MSQGDFDTPFVQVVGPTDGWILEQLARRLASKLPYARFVPDSPQEHPETKLVYYVNYALWHQPSRYVDVGFFTHLDERHEFINRAKSMNYCISMSKLYSELLSKNGVERVEHIPMGCDFYRYRPSLVLGVFGRLEHPRKGAQMLPSLRRMPFVRLVTTEGTVDTQDLRSMYERVDYVLIPATTEGGPLSLLEGLAMGKPIIAPTGVGMVPEFTNDQFVIPYRAGDIDSLKEVVHRCWEKKCSARRLVENRTWDHWAADHDRTFRRVLYEHGKSLPTAAPGFRFGLMSECDLDSIDANDTPSIESDIDSISRLWFHGRYAEAEQAIGDLRHRIPSMSGIARTLTTMRDAPAVHWDARGIRSASVKD